jgi:ParB family chromosome partitioning protein
MTKFEDIPLELIEIGPSQSRSRKIDVEIDDLATNIEKVGLLNPVTVFKTDGKYELLAGQRRFLAVTRLGWKKISAQVIDKPKDPIKAKAISFSETFMRKNMVLADLVDACVAFYHKYGSMKTVSEELGLPYDDVRKYVKFDRLPEELKEMVNADKVRLDVALKAVNAATQPDGTVVDDKAVVLANEMAKMDTLTQRALVKQAQDNPTASVESLIETVRKPVSRKRLVLDMMLADYQSLKKYSEAEKAASEEEAAVDLIVEGLESKGYLSEAETT